MRNLPGVLEVSSSAVADNWKRHICFAVGDKEGVAGGGVGGVADNWKRHICFAVGDKEDVAGG